jgi:pyridoxamine 5'-phosphate oxidase
MFNFKKTEMEQNSNLHQILSFANQNPACHLATVEGDQPRVRGLLMWYADETGFYFHTASTKRLPKQLQVNPKVEVAFLKPTDNPTEMEAMRLNGVAKILIDKSLEERLLTERPWLREFEKIAPDSRPVIFKISKGEAYIWNMSVNLQEEKIEKVKI